MVHYCLTCSIKDMNVKDPMPNAKAPVIITKVEGHKNIVLLDVSAKVLLQTRYLCMMRVGKILIGLV